ncbi:photoreceptor outer segment membrane glycoprotein 2 isoform X1 [Danio rerio]|uniref:Peripherin 2-like a n=6 Tax=Danio rerio TaxID=7955 RepID=A0A8M2B5B9_DANRE|nr:photoreceptor outer segment membrane glycoprotein 2-like isoform X1 [Danio rerio]XP_009291504.1 photoreceptor outer segment membrane glycoprotein 2-like isoform X1 [Danio rerio]XP_021323199.1 photoreceptor outer segment membrane glycoprotein 2-like isoform X1 [Danio rerio]|eukprot:XP_005158919.1 photoreceptor outer segment membrane glycoprotein 2-like isoform X1 [Danio rerio]
MAVLPVRFTKTKRDKLAQVLWVLNWISVVTGIILFSLGIFLKVEIYKRQDLMAEGQLQSVPNMLIVVGLIACVINFLGGKICYDCVDSSRFLHWKLVMLPYIICMFFFTLSVLVGALMCYSMHSQLEESLTLGLRDAMRYYKDTDTPGRCFLKRTVDLLQMQFQCCGNEGFRDWFQIQWVSNRYLDMSQREVVDRLRSNVESKYLMDGVPFSCCNVNSPRPCIQHQISNNSAHFNYDYQTEELNLWMRGCRQALLQYYTNIMHSIGLMVLIIWLFELSVLTGVRYLQTSLENVLRQGDPECESDGWLLENSFVETARSNFNIIKHLSKFNQINTASNRDPNTDRPSTAHYGPDNVPPKPHPADG